ncbi:MAG: glycoside hydrolase family 1 protein [Aerococcus sp.]|nr:glycoside hydrolase family 1 protein [Aerococcus sp.]
MWYQFPKDFYWGTSTSGVQTEGSQPGDGKGLNVWDDWFQREPDRFYRQIGPAKASSLYTHYVQDVELLAATGHNLFRTSIQWSRLIPTGRGEVNAEAVRFYRDFFTRIKNKGIQLMVNLYHFDLPAVYLTIGGWENPQVVRDYIAYAKTCLEQFGDLVDYWTTFNEPIVPVEMGYLNTYHWPAITDGKRAVLVAYHTQLASAGAVEIFHQAKASPVGIILNLTPAYPRSDRWEDKKAAEVAELFQARSFLDPSLKGYYPQPLVDLLRRDNLLPNTTSEELALIKNNTVDFLGVNYYQPLRVAAPSNHAEDSPWTPERYYVPYQWPKAKMNPYRGWEIYEQGIYDIAKNIQHNYGNVPWLVTENGMGVADEERFAVDGVIQDDYRIAFIKDHLRLLHQAIAEGANCRGYLLWTFIDCWSWLNSYKNRYGLVALDLETGKRTVKKSGHWFKQLHDNNGFESD